MGRELDKLKDELGTVNIRINSLREEVDIKVKCAESLIKRQELLRYKIREMEK